MKSTNARIPAWLLLIAILAAMLAACNAAPAAETTPTPAPETAPSIVRDPADLPAPLSDRPAQNLRIFIGVGGPNYTSSFHVIGEIFDRVIDQASLTASPFTDVQTTLVPPGGATMVEFTVQVPGRYLLVDHALARLEHGLAGYLEVEGPDQPEVFHSDEAADGSGH